MSVTAHRREQPAKAHKRVSCPKTFVLFMAVMVFLGLFAVTETGVADRFQENSVPAIGQNASDVKSFDATKKGPRVLFVGNSITLHGPRPDIGWTRNCGMAASSPDKDYVHLLQRRIVAACPEAQCCLLQVSGTFERSFYEKDWSCEKNFRWAKEFKPDIVICFFGANVPKEYDSGTMAKAPARTFGAALESFRDYLDHGGRTKFIFSQGFYVRPKLDAEKEDLARRRGDVFIDISDIRARADAHGGWNHPGDLGMKLIADRFWGGVSDLISNWGAVTVHMDFKQETQPQRKVIKQ